MGARLQRAVGPQRPKLSSLLPDLAAGSVAGFTAEQVEEVRMVVRMFPIFLTTIFYWTIYSQVLLPPPLPEAFPPLLLNPSAHCWSR